MRERLTSYLLVSFVAVAVWLYAEAETRERETVNARVQFVPGNSGWFVQSSDDFDRRVILEIEGSRGAISRANDILGQGPLQLTPGMPGVPAAEGSFDVALADAIAEHPALARTNVSVYSARPTRVSVVVEDMETRTLPIVPRLPGLPLGGEVTVQPAEIEVAARSSLWLGVPDDASLRVALTPEQRAALPASGRVNLDATVQLPDQLRETAGVELARRTVTLSFELVESVATQSTRVPVLVVVSPTELGRWTVTIADGDRFKDVELVGPPETIERLTGRDDPAVAIFYLTLADLEAGGGEKTVRLQTRSGAPIPAEVTAELADTSVSYEAVRIESP